jgi:hypothetical protein
MVAASRKQPVVINLVDDDEDVGSQTKVYGGGILPAVSQINTEPLPGKITVPESRLESLRQNLVFTRNYYDYYQRQRDGDCGLVSVNNLVGFGALSENLMNEVQDRLREKQPDRLHIYVCCYSIYVFNCSQNGSLSHGWSFAVLNEACAKRNISLKKIKGGIAQRVAALKNNEGKYLVCAVNGPKVSHFFGLDNDRNLVFEGNLDSPLVSDSTALKYCTWDNLRAITHVYKVTLTVDLNKLASC